MVTIWNIKSHMLNYLTLIEGNLKCGYFSHDIYDEDGYCSKALYNDLIDFWKNFGSEKDIMYVISGKYSSYQLDIDGGRSHFIYHSEITSLLFNYIYFTLKMTKNEYENNIYNTCDLTDDITYMYNDPQYLRNLKIEKITIDE